LLEFFNLLLANSVTVLSKTTESAGFCNGENEICCLLEFYTAQNDSFLTTFRDTLSVTPSRFKWPLGPIGCPGTLARTCHSTLRKIPENADLKTKET